MSYDLYFQKKNKEPFTREEFTEYFSKRPRYKVEKGQALYENDDTGVYFIMEHNELGKAEDPEDPAQHSPATLNLKYLRPHIFGLEAEPEVAAFVDAFDFSIIDLQNEGNPTTVYNKDAFIRGWNIGNKFGYDSIGKDNPDVKKVVMPSAEIERCWRWNLNKAALQNKLGVNIFIPKIGFHKQDGKVRSLVVWSEAIPTAFPKVESVLVFRQSMAPSRGFFVKKQNDFTVFDYEKVAPLLGDTHKNENGDYRTLLSQEKSGEWVIALPASDTIPEPVSVDRILDAELFE